MNCKRTIRHNICLLICQHLHVCALLLILGTLYKPLDYVITSLKITVNYEVYFRGPKNYLNNLVTYAREEW